MCRHCADGLFCISRCGLITVSSLANKGLAARRLLLLNLAFGACAVEHLKLVRTAPACDGPYLKETGGLGTHARVEVALGAFDVVVEVVAECVH